MFTRQVSGNVVTLQYRALEASTDALSSFGSGCVTLLQVFVSGGYYSFGVDVWSIACIMAELMRCYCIACESEKHEVARVLALQLARLVC